MVTTAELLARVADYPHISRPETDEQWGAIVDAVADLVQRTRDLQTQVDRLGVPVWPRAFDLMRLAEWRRLAIETHGYLRTCKDKGHGTDFDGREKAMYALTAMAQRIDVHLDAALAHHDPHGTDFVLVLDLENLTDEQRKEARQKMLTVDANVTRLIGALMGMPSTQFGFGEAVGMIAQCAFVNAVQVDADAARALAAAVGENLQHAGIAPHPPSVAAMAEASRLLHEKLTAIKALRDAPIGAAN
jgi:hypothetical protein